MEFSDIGIGFFAAAPGFRWSPAADSSPVTKTASQTTTVRIDAQRIVGFILS
jgi:hypothetical protein